MNTMDTNPAQTTPVPSPAPVVPPIQVQTPPVATAAPVAPGPMPEQPTLQSSSGGSHKILITILIVFIIVIGAGIAYMMLVSNATTQLPEKLTTVAPAPQLSPTIDPIEEKKMMQQKDTSDTQLTQDVTETDTALQGLDTQINAVDKGLNDQPANLN